MIKIFATIDFVPILVSKSWSQKFLFTKILVKKLQKLLVTIILVAKMLVAKVYVTKFLVAKILIVNILDAKIFVALARAA